MKDKTSRENNGLSGTYNLMRTNFIDDTLMISSKLCFKSCERPPKRIFAQHALKIGL